MRVCRSKEEEEEDEEEEEEDHESVPVQRREARGVNVGQLTKHRSAVAT